MRLRKIFPTPVLLVLGFPLIWACEDSVTGPPSESLYPGTQLVLVPRLAELGVGMTLNLQPHFIGEAPGEFLGRDDVEWVSSNPSIAEVDDGGMVLALAQGEVIITLNRGPFQAWARIRVGPERLENSPPFHRHHEDLRAP